MMKEKLFVRFPRLFFAVHAYRRTGYTSAGRVAPLRETKKYHANLPALRRLSFGASATEAQPTRWQAGAQRRKAIRAFILATGVICIFLYSGCRPRPLDIKINQPEPKLVVASQVIPNSFILVALTQSFSALADATNQDTVTNDFLDGVAVKDAFVTVSYLNKIDTLFMLVPGVYANFYITLNDYTVYTLYAKYPASGLEITAPTTLLPKVAFDSITPRIIRTAEDTTIEVDLAFTDPPGIDNYYVISYYTQTADTNGLNINRFFNSGTGQLEDFDVISDKTFSNNLYTHTKKLKSEIQQNDTIAVTLSNISEGYYKFLTAYKKSGSLFNQITGEPIDYPTNVINGYGYFNTYYPDVRVFDLNTYRKVMSK